MTTLLHISASPRGEASESLQIARVFIESYREAHPGADVSPGTCGTAACRSSARPPPRRR